MSTVPMGIKGYPELRSYFYARYFFDRTRHCWCCNIAGVLLSPFSLWTLLLVLPILSGGTASCKR